MPLPFPFTNFDGPSPVYLANFLTGTLPSGVTVSSPSTGGLVTDSTGKLTYKPNNLLLNSATLLTQSITTTVGVNYIISFYGTGTVTLSGAATNVIVGTGAGNQVYAKITATTTSLTLTVVGSVTSAVAAAVTYETAPRPGDQVITGASAYYGPAFDYSATSVGTPIGLRIWESRTNLATYSSQFTNAVWLVYGTAVTASAATGPDGTAGAANFYDTASTRTHVIVRIDIDFSVAAYTWSVYVKPNGRRYIALGAVQSDAGQLVVFDLQTGTAVGTINGAGGAGSSTVASYSIQAAANGFYRCIVSYNKAPTSAYPAVYLMNGTATANLTYAGDGASGVYLWGAQVEQVSFAGPYIPTGSAAVTAAADVVSFTDTALSTLQGTVGSTIVDFTPATIASGSTLIGDSASTKARLLLSASSYLGTYNGTTELDTTSAPTVNTETRGAVAWDASGRSVVLGGGTVATDANAIGSIAGANLGSRTSTPSNFESGWYKSTAIYNQRLANNVLKYKTNVGAPY